MIFSSDPKVATAQAAVIVGLLAYMMLLRWLMRRR